MSKKTKTIISFICCLSIAFSPALSLANETETTGLVTQLEQGDSAPFKGILLSNDTAAKLFADIKFSEKECDARVEKETDALQIKHKSLIKSCELKAKIESERLAGMISVRDDRIKFLEKNYNPPAWYESGEFWFAVGVIAGIGITATAGYAIGQAK